MVLAVVQGRGRQSRRPKPSGCGRVSPVRRGAIHSCGLGVWTSRGAGCAIELTAEDLASEKGRLEVPALLPQREPPAHQRSNNAPQPLNSDLGLVDLNVSRRSADRDREIGGILLRRLGKSCYRGATGGDNSCWHSPFNRPILAVASPWVPKFREAFNRP